MTRAGRAEDHRRVVPAWRTSETASLAIFGASLVGWVLIGLSKLRAFGGPGLGVFAVAARDVAAGEELLYCYGLKWWLGRLRLEVRERERERESV